MIKYTALLRGINVGGKNRISMKELKTVFEEIGFLNVSTYINSGNVIFSTENKDKNEITKKIESVIIDKFSLSIPVIILSTNELSDILENAPDWWWYNNKEIVNYAIFVISPISVKEVFEKVGEIKPEYEKITYYNNVIFWSTPLNVFQKTRWSKIASSPVNNNVTIRNSNTTKKILEILKN